MSFIKIYLFMLALWPLMIQADSYAEVDSSITLEGEVVKKPNQQPLFQLINGPKQDCCNLQLAGNTKSGIYTIYPYATDLNRRIQVYCDLQTAGGGWTVIQRREPVTGPVERFYLEWENYQDGFGQLGYSHWLGLENIVALTSGYDQAIRFDLEDWEGQKRNAVYQTFYVGTKEDKYKLDVSNHTGDAGESFMAEHSGKYFSTKDADNDVWPNHCAQSFKGGWWYGKCHHSNLNGLYVVNGSHVTYADGVNWSAFRGHNYALKETTMKIRNRNYPNGCQSN